MIRTSIQIGGTPISDHDFKRVSLTQRIGSHHHFVIACELKPDKGFLLDKAKTWIGETISIGFDHSSDSDIDFTPVKTIFKGVVKSLELGRRSGAGELLVKGKSPTILMDDGPMTRSFTDAGLQEIVDKVMKPYKKGFSKVEVSPMRHTNSIPYTVQYRESNFDFINRLANRFGEWFYYSGTEMYFGKLGEGEKIELDFGENELKYFDLNVEALPQKAKLIAYDYKTDKLISKNTPESFKSSDLGKHAVDLGKSKIFSEAAFMNFQFDIDEASLDQRAKRHEEISGGELVVFRGVSSNASIVPGVRITVKDKKIKEDYGKFIVTGVSHSIGEGGDYSNSFEAVPEELEMAPLTGTPNSSQCETQLARVVDTNDADEIGRVKVEFFWQVDSGETSPWIRVATPYMGNNKGFYIIPEVDDQVLVAFEENDPDKPYVLSGMYHGKAKPEWFDSENKFKGFKSRGENLWQFDDNSQSIKISAPKEMTLHAGTKISLTTGSDDGSKKDGKSDSEIHINVGDGTVKINAKHVIVESADTIDMAAGKNISESAGQNFEISAGQNLEVTAGQKLSESAGTNLEMEAAQIKAKASAKAEVSGANVDIKGSALVNVKGALVKIN